jgi:hypothetical protein
MEISAVGERKIYGPALLVTGKHAGSFVVLQSETSDTLIVTTMILQNEQHRSFFKDLFAFLRDSLST